MALTASHHDSDLQIWDNAAFVHAADEPCHDSRLLVLETDARKENLSPNTRKSPATTLLSNNHPLSQAQQGKPLKVLFKQGLLAPVKPAADDETLDSEIHAIEKEMERLSERLTVLRLQKEANPNPGKEACVEIISVKQSSKTPKIVRIQAASPEVTKCRPRGVSMCPAEIAGGVPLMQPADKPENRRKSCFWKLPPLAKEEVGARDTKSRRLSLISNKNGSRTTSPKTRPSKIPDHRRGISTVGSKILGKRDEASLNRLQPKKLFGDGSSSVSKPLKNARVVASRYNQIPARAARSSPEKESRKKSVQDRKSQLSGRDRGSERKTWSSGEEERSSMTSSRTSASTTSALELEEMGEGLPRIKAVRLVEMSPRDSGCAKRVAELEGKRTYFSYEPAEKGGAPPVCQVLGFEDDD